MQHWRLSPITEQYLSGGAYFVFALVAIALLATWAASVFFTPLPLQRRLVLAALRLALIFTLLFILLRPSHIITENEKQSATLLLLVDQSRSMQIQDTPSGESRWRQMKSLLMNLRGPLERLREEQEFEISVYAFDKNAEAIDLDEFLAATTLPDGSESGYGVSMQDVLRREDGKRLLGMILLGDGAEQTVGITETDPDSVARMLERLGCPLYAVPFGDRKGSGEVRDIEVSSMPDDFVVFAKNRVPIRGTLQISGYLNKDLPLELVLVGPNAKEEVVATQQVTQGETNADIAFEFDYIPDKPGKYKIVVQVPPQEGEITTDNNALPAVLTVLEGGIRILYVEGEIRREQRFLRRALASSPDMDVTLLTLNPRDRNTWPRKDLASYFEPGAYDVTILGDVDARVFFQGSISKREKGDLQSLRESVLDGAGLLMLGGWHSFRAGGYHTTPLATISPVKMDPQIDRFVIQQFDEPVDQSLHLPGPLAMQPTLPWGAQSEIMQITSDGNNRSAWLRLPPLTGANRFRGIKSGARVLADDGKGNPLLVTAEPGGRVISFAGDSTWRWVMQGFRESYQRFWRQVVLWLARKEEQKINDIWVKLDRRRFTPGERITFEAGQRKGKGDSEKLQLVASILGPDGRREEIPLVRNGENFSGILRDCETLGNYSLTVAAKGKAPDRSDSAQFFVYTKDRELAGATSDASMLKSLAYQTRDVGGKVVSPEELNNLVQELIITPLEMEEKIKVSVSFWDKWYVLIIFVSLIGTEWFLRKLWRLV